jgi:hypothetical protein
MRTTTTTTRRLLLPLAAVLAAVAILAVVVALTRYDRDAAEAGQDAAVGAVPGQAGAPGAARPAATAAGDPASNPATAGLPRVAGTATTTDVVIVWDRRGGAGVAPAQRGQGASKQLKLDLTVSPAGNRALAVVRVRNLTTRRVALIGTLQLLANGPEAATVSRLRLNRPLAVGGTSTATLPLRPGRSGIYRIRAVFTP